MKIAFANKIYYGDFCPNHNYFHFDGCGNIVNFDFVSSVIDIDELVNYIVNNEDYLYNDEIEAVFDEWNDEEDDD